MGREIPILMSGPLVRATLEGAKPEYARSYPAKTQTRRPIKPQPGPDIVDFEYDPDADLWLGNTQEDNDLGYCSSWSARIGGPGDVLWVRETWDWRDWQSMANRKVRIAYAADGAQVDTIAPCDWNPVVYNAARWHPSIHMPRWASRITLPLVRVRVERVQDISEADAWAEGYGEHWKRRVKEAGADGPLGRPDARGWFAKVWSELYGTWAQNPWVAVYEWGQIEVSR